MNPKVLRVAGRVDGQTVLWASPAYEDQETISPHLSNGTPLLALAKHENEASNIFYKVITPDGRVGWVFVGEVTK